MSFYVQYNSDKLKLLSDGITNELVFDDMAFADMYLNILTAETQGLDNWGIILNQSRNVKSGEAYAGVFGFNTGTIPPDTNAYPQNFGHGTFYNEIYAPTLNLNDTQYRGLLYLLYRKYTTNNSLFDLNEIIQSYEKVGRITPRGIPFVKSDYPLEITYNFPYVVDLYEIQLFRKTECLARPAGYTINLIIGA